MRAVGYIRVSTAEQARDGFGLADQEAKIRALAGLKGWTLGEVYIDAARSGRTTAGREALLKMLADAKRGAFDRLIFKRFDRLGRNLREMLTNCDTLEALDVSLVSIDEDIDTSTPHGRMMRNMIGTFAEFEREIIVDRIKAGIGEKAREGYLVGPAPLGYRKVNKKELEADEHAPAVVALFERYAAGGQSLRDLSQWAIAQGLESTEGKPLDRLSIRKILTNPAYVGDVVYHPRRSDRTVFAGTHMPLVSRDLFDQVQEQLASRRYSKPVMSWGREPYPLTGVAACAGCGSPLMGCRANRARLRYMRCSTTARRGRAACSQPMILADMVEDQVGAYVEGMKLPLEYVQAVIQELRDTEDPKDHREEQAELEAKIDAWRRLFVIDDIDERRYRQETAPLRQRLTAIAAAAPTTDIERAMYHITRAGSLWRQSERQEQRDFVLRVFERIVVEGAQVTEIKPKPAYAPLFAIDRAERFGNEMGVIWLPGLVSRPLDYTPVANVWTSELFGVPCLA